MRPGWAVHANSLSAPAGWWSIRQAQKTIKTAKGNINNLIYEAIDILWHFCDSRGGVSPRANRPSATNRDKKRHPPPGAVLGADAALTQNMVDGVATFDDVVRKMRRDAKGQAKPRVNRLARAQRDLAIFGVVE